MCQCSLTSQMNGRMILAEGWMDDVLLMFAVQVPLVGSVVMEMCFPPISFLHTRLRTATLRHDADGQAVLLNLLLRNYLHFNLYDQAEKLVSKSVFPELANNNEWARYLYYTGEGVGGSDTCTTQVRLYIWPHMCC